MGLELLGIPVDRVGMGVNVERISIHWVPIFFPFLGASYG